MHKLSPRYRDDAPGGVPEDLRQYLDDHFLRTLPNLTVAHPKLLVVFSGGNAVGKSTLAARLQDELQALVLSNDAMKLCIKQRHPEMDRDQLNKLTWQYSMDLYSRLDKLTPNGLVVRDGVIDWYYDRILPTFKERGYEPFVIAYDLSRAKREALIRTRGDTPIVTVDRLLLLMEDHDIHIARFRSEYTPDYTFHDDTLFEYDGVIAALKTRLQTLKTSE